MLRGLSTVDRHFAVDRHDELTVSDYAEFGVPEPAGRLHITDEARSLVSRPMIRDEEGIGEDGADFEKLRRRPRARSESAVRQMRESEQLAATASMIRSSEEFVDVFGGQYVALQAGRMFFRPTKEEARSTLEEGGLALVFQVPTKAKVVNNERRNTPVHEHNVRAFIASLPTLRRDHPGEWVAIHEGHVVGIAADRRALLAEYHRPDRLPMFVAEIPRTDEEDDER